jgi:hypothetical protein
MRAVPFSEGCAPNTFLSASNIFTTKVAVSVSLICSSVIPNLYRGVRSLPLYFISQMLAIISVFGVPNRFVINRTSAG